MDFEDEDYVRLFTRDTPTWKSWKWEAKATIGPLMRKLSRGGRLDWPAGGDAAVYVAAAIDLPVKVVVVALREYVRTETIVMGDGHLVMPRFVPGQNAKRRTISRAQRTAEWKERVGYVHPKKPRGDAVETRGDTPSPAETFSPLPHRFPSASPSPSPSPESSLRSDHARPRDEIEHALVAPSLTGEPPPASPANDIPGEEPLALLHACSPSPSKPRRGKPRVDYPDGLDEHLLASLQAACRALTPPLRGPRKVTDGMRDLLRKLWAECEPTVEDIDHVVAVRAAMTRRGEPYGSLTWDSICVASNFRRWLAERVDASPAQAGRADVTSRPTQSGVLDIRAARAAAKEPAP